MAKPTLFQAVADFMGPLNAEYARLIDEYPAEKPVVIKFGGYEYVTTLADFKQLNEAYRIAFEAKLTRDAKKAKGTLL